MIEFGKSLRAARETKGLTISQLAESTHILSQIVEGLENEDFSKIVAPIYGRGFIKLYCEAVGLEPQPFIEQFMAIYNGTDGKSAAPAPVTTTDLDDASPETRPAEGTKLPFPLNGRMLAIAASAAVVLLLLALGLRALYHATAADSAATATEETVESPATPAAAATPRQPLPVKSFYAD